MARLIVAVQAALLFDRTGVNLRMKRHKSMQIHAAPQADRALPRKGHDGTRSLLSSDAISFVFTGRDDLQAEAARFASARKY